MRQNIFKNVRQILSHNIRFIVLCFFFEAFLVSRAINANATECVENMDFKIHNNSNYLSFASNKCGYKLKCIVTYGSDSNVVYLDAYQTISGRGCLNSQICFNRNGYSEITYICHKWD